jgi:hypothetical protein
MPEVFICGGGPPTKSNAKAGAIAETVKAPPAAIPATRILIGPVTDNLRSRELPIIDMTGKAITGKALAGRALAGRAMTGRAMTSRHLIDEELITRGLAMDER